MMKLKLWREINGLTLESVAIRVGAGNASVVRRYELDMMVPRPRIMTRIYLMTAGQVQPNDFYDLPDLGETDAGDPDLCAEASAQAEPQRAAA